MNDIDAWIKYPKHRIWFNKLWLAEQLGYQCGPAGLPPLETNIYIVRPVYNLRGMGLKSRFQVIEANDVTAVEPGYFWCEKFEGNHISASFNFFHNTIGKWKPFSAFQGFRNPSNPLYKFDKWSRIPLDQVPKVPRLLNKLSDVSIINVEFIGDKIIEVHLRDSPDPDYDEIYPVWETNKIDMDCEFIPSVDDADGHLPEKRLGFYVKNR